MAVQPLIEDVHTLIVNDVGPLKENGSFWVMDRRNNNIFAVPDIPIVREFFKLNLKDISSDDCPKDISSERERDDCSQDISSNDCSKDIFLDDCLKKDLSKNVTYNCVENIENISDNDKDQSATHWEHSAIMLLFYLYKDHLPLFKNDKIRNNIVWKKIGNCLKEKGYTYTVKQIENKWKNLRKNYIKVKDHNSKSGASYKKCKYYDEMEEIYGKSPIVQPVALASNLSQKVSSFSFDEEQTSDEDSDIAPPPKKSKMEKQLHALTEYMEKNEKAKERRHKERLEYQKEAVETYKEVMSKLLEKL
ncbi:trihelix transcription factor GTL1-like [Pseudomyrmex gracilis]|uniref:trihelix transcription factor GTL1-like n=1 Tax=Pseudomyrmex gracilis TaxID=219809 RepID=UPI000995DF06|nr:trihelix transcription factor GTL1-like [Pseudomyrmex gracilis]